MMAERRKTVLVVDHDGIFSDRFDNIITIVKDEQGSHIKD
jgi:DNA repair exonuclease SbcCD ATPase subunit